MMITFSKACNWAEEQQKIICSVGAPLSKELLIIAGKVGVQYPEKIRISLVDCIPLPKELLTHEEFEKTKLETTNTWGRTFYYGIYIVNEQKDNRELLAHEFVHVAQYEELGGIEAFLSKYYNEIKTYGYADAPLEQEAINRVLGLKSLKLI